MKNILPLVALLLFHTGFAQTATGTSGNNAILPAATVVVHKDPRIDALVKKKSAINKVTKKATDRTMKGYRLMVVNTNRRDEAIGAKTKVYTYFPELKAYLQYQSPYFKLKAGNFKTREEAERYRRKMASMFPKGVFIVNDTIEVKAERESEEEN